MATSVEDGSLERFRSEAQAIRERADWHIFALLCSAALVVTSLFAVVLLLRTPDSVFLWPVLGGWLACLATIWRTRRSRRIHTGIAVLAALMTLGISGVVMVQRGAHAPALVYGLATVAVSLIAGRERLALGLGLWLMVWAGGLTWASQTGRLSIEAQNPLGVDIARLLAFVVTLLLIGGAARIVQRKRQGLDALLERALKLTEAERDEAQGLAERRARAVVEIGHEIRTPMTGIVGVAQLLSQKSLSPVQRQLLAIQRQSAERLLQLVNAVLNQAKLESAPAAAADAPYPPRVLAAEVTELFAPRAHRKGVEIIWLAEPGLPTCVLGDAMRVRQVLSNLVSNAVKFTDSGSVQVHLLAPAAGRWRIEVRDSGRGIAAHALDATFERYVSGAVGEDQRLSTGLGLPISRELAQLMGGELTLRSEVGAGSCFTLDLPYQAAPGKPPEEALPEPIPAGRLWVAGASAPLELQLRFLLGDLGVDVRFVDSPPSAQQWEQGVGQPQALMVDAWVGHGRCAEQLPAILTQAQPLGQRVIVVSSVAQDAAFGMLESIWQVFRPPSRDALLEALAWAFDSGAPAAPVPPITTNRPRVLLADDNPVNRIIGQAMLEELGAEVTTVASGQSALDESLRRPFQLVLMDLQMPEMDGLEAARRLRAQEDASGLPHTPIVAVTGQLLAEVEAACHQAGMADVLPKPYTIEQLRNVLAVHLGKTTV